MSRWIVRISAVFCFLLTAEIGFAQSFPSKPIRILSSGVAQQILSRVIGEEISKSLGQPVVSEDRASVVIAAEAVAVAKPDGYTVLLTGGNFHLTPLTQKTNYDPIRDFSMIAIVGTAPLVLYVTPSLNVKSVQELIGVAKEHPGELNGTIGGLGGGAHLVLEQFNSLAGVKIVAVPYAAGSMELADLISGRVQLTFAPPSPYMEQVKAGSLIALGVTSQTPSALVPGLPPIAATLPGFERINMTIMAAPKGTPPEVVERLNREVVKALATKEVKDKLLAAGLEIGGGTPQEADKLLAADVAKLSAQIKALGLEFK